MVNIKKVASCFLFCYKVSNSEKSALELKGHDMGILKIIADIDRTTKKIDKATQAIDKLSNIFEAKPTPSKKPLPIEEREKLVRARIKEKGLQSLFRDIYFDL